MHQLLRFLRVPARRPGLTRNAILALALAPLPLGATPICRWVDGRGGTQLSQEVPDAYRSSAICTDSLQHELPPDQRRAAERNAAEARRRALQDVEPVAELPQPTTATPVPDRVKRPAEAVTEDTDCATWWRLFDESAECLGAFRTVRGAIKAEAFDVCNVVPGPEPVCGPLRD